MAAKEGVEKTKLLAEGRDAGVNFAAVQKLTRQAPLPGINSSLSKQVFGADISKGIAYVGAPSDAGGYTIVRVVKASDAPASNPEQLKSIAQRLSSQASGDINNAYLTALKDSIKVEMKKGVVDAKKVDPIELDTSPKKS